MNGSPRRTRSSFEFWFAIGFASFSLNRPSTKSPVMPENPSPAGWPTGAAWGGPAWGGGAPIGARLTWPRWDT